MALPALDAPRRRSRLSEARAWLAGMAVALLSVARPACAQPAPAPTPQDDLQSFAAAEVLRLALFDLRSVQEPTADDYAVAYLLLSRAEALTPDDAELVRRRVEAAWNWGDDDALIASTKRLLELDRTDTLAQLRLLSVMFSRLQRVEDRVAAYRRALALPDRDLDPAIRSRLALDCALLLRENGDFKGFLETLKTALKLDPTNKDTALLALSFYEERAGDLPGRLDLLQNLLLADPLDPNVHRRLGLELARVQAWRPARRFIRNSFGILGHAGHVRDFREQTELLIVDWMVEGPKKCYDAVTRELIATRKNLRKQREDMIAENLDITRLPKEEDLRLDFVVEPLRLVSALAIPDPDAARASITDLSATVAESADGFMDPLRRPQGMSDDEARNSVQGRRFDLQLWRCLASMDVDKIEPDLPAATEGLDEDDPNVLTLRAYHAARTGNLDAARDALARVSELSVWSELARAAIAQAAQQPEEELKAYIAAVEQSPLTPAGAHAATCARLLADTLRRPAADPAMIARLTKFAEGVPAWVDAMSTSPNSFQSFSVALDRATLSPIETPRVTVSIRNNAPVPLGFGAARAINSRLLFTPTLDAGGQSMHSIAAPEILDAERRLRLAPRERIEFVFAPDCGATGWLAQTMCTATSRARWRVLQGFDVRADGTKDVGAGCLEDSTSSLVRTVLADAKEPPPSLAAKIKDCAEMHLPSVLIGARSVLVTQSDTIAESDRDALVAALAARYPTLSPLGRTLMLCVLPPAAELPELKPLDDAAAAETDPFVLPIAIVSRAADAASPLLAAAKPDSDVAQLAALQRDRLANGSKTYSTTGTGLVEPLRKLLAKSESAGKGK